jgi:hypothetical protein
MVSRAAALLIAMEISTKAEQLAAVLRTRLSNGRTVIGIDGAPASGKSTVAVAVAPMLNATLFSIDNFLNRHEGRYFESLRLKELKSQIGTAQGTVIVEGICLLQALEAISVQHDQLVYVKRMEGGWSDEEECVITGDPEERIAELLARQQEFDQAAGFTFSTELPPPHAEVIRYHAKYRPQDRATVEYWTTL